ncbi:PIG-L family deacetylase [Candidatus Woesebacteria bacterium]|nr:PIG-L family deacetylase [Candidatus Woesebacteria bacterium]MCD8507390.1 PIG-L family deacetylase [Candidatus Woesebacteria bacterium]MCD8527025.1 PIG-L family deacetylase [Candidatus Woesebacteria bacterium]MCD8545911.1 PIG-L family deacetylase [Candidatus Woesebacteria bacterium]
MAKVLAVFAHPDDESFGPGGTLALWAQANAEIHLVCVTRGEVGCNTTDEPTAEVRERELRAAADILGISSVEFLNFVDGDLSNRSMIALADILGKKIESFEPDTVLTFGLNGVSGHLDHMAVASATTQAFKRTAKEGEIYYYVLPKRYTDAVGDYFVYFPDGYEEDQIDVEIDVSLAWEERMQAMHCHKSQLDDILEITKNPAFQEKKEHFIVRTLADLRPPASGTNHDDTAAQ